MHELERYKFLNLIDARDYIDMSIRHNIYDLQFPFGRPLDQL